MGTGGVIFVLETNLNLTLYLCQSHVCTADVHKIHLTVCVIASDTQLVSHHTAHARREAL